MRSHFRKTSRIGSFIYGLTLPLQSFTLLLKHSKLLFFCCLPFLVTLTAYALMFVKAQGLLKEFTAHTFSLWGLNPESSLAGLFLFLSKLMFLLLGAISFSFVGNIITWPLNDFIAESTESYCSPPLPPVPSIRVINRIKIIGIDLIKSIFVATLSCVSLLLSLLPFLNFLAILLAILLLSFQFISYPQTRRGEGIFEGIRFLFKHFYACLGFGAGIAFLFSIPFLSCFFLPLAVTGGTLLYARTKGSSYLPVLQ